MAGRSTSMASFCRENESRDCFIAISESKPFWEGEDVAVDVSEASTLCFFREDRAAGSDTKLLPLLFLATLRTSCIVVLVEVFGEEIVC